MNNCHLDHTCPPLMSDSRFGTDYRPNCYIQHSIINDTGALNSRDLRNKMIHNGVAIIDDNLTKFEHHYGCPSCNYYHPDPNGHISKHAHHHTKLHPFKDSKHYVDKYLLDERDQHHIRALPKQDVHHEDRHCVKAKHNPKHQHHHLEHKHCNCSVCMNKHGVELKHRKHKTKHAKSWFRKWFM